MEFMKHMDGLSFLTLTLTLTTLVPNPASGRDYEKDIDVILNLPENDILNYYFPFLKWIDYKTGQQPSTTPTPVDHINPPNTNTNTHTQHIPSQAGSSTVYTETDKRFGNVPYYRKQDDLETWKQFMETIGSGSTFIYDHCGYIVGLRVPSEDETAVTYRQSGVAALQGDQDQCCTTTESYYTNRTLTDVRGVTRTIRQSPTAYQFIRHGMCGVRGFCRGRCVLTYINLCLFTATDPNQCKFFKVPGYCTCKNFG